jgi:hypothetical protein
MHDCLPSFLIDCTQESTIGTTLAQTVLEIGATLTANAGKSTDTGKPFGTRGCLGIARSRNVNGDYARIICNGSIRADITAGTVRALQKKE